MIAHPAQGAVERSPLFRHMAHDDRARTIASAITQDVARGEQVVQAQQDGGDIYIVARGTLLANQFARSGREIGYRRLEPGAYFGELSAIDGLPRSVNVIALSDSRIVRLPAVLVRSLLDDCPGFSRALLEDLGRMVRSLSSRLFDHHAVSAGCRLQIEILRMAIQSGIAADAATIPDMPTHAEMAILIGAQREVVTREYNRLEETGLISRRGRALTIPRVAALVAEIERLGGDVPG